MADDPPAYPPPQPLAPQAPAAPGAPPPTFSSTVHGAGSPTAIQVPRAAGTRRWWMVIIGILVILFSLVPLLVGAGLLLAEGALNIADAEAEDVFPDADLSFTADEGQQYDVFLSGRHVNEGDASRVNCQITLADGDEIEVDGTVQGVAVEGATSSVGSFDGVEGFTEVRCTGLDNGEPIYVGRDRPALERGGWIGVGLGVAGVLAGVGLLMAGLFWRKAPKGPGFTPVPGPA